MKPNLKQYSLSELEQIRDSFAEELTQAAAGQQTSLPYHVNELPATPVLPQDSRRQVLVIGGTNFESAKVSKSDGDFQLANQSKGIVPVFDTGKALLEFIGLHLQPDIQFLALNFAWGLDPILRKGLPDGRVGTGSKEHTFEGLRGLVLGEAIERYIWRQQKQKIRVAVANDTVCLILSGKMIAQEETIVGGIVGTGMNFGFFEDSRHIINLEAAQFNKFSQSASGRIIDSHSNNPGQNAFEKEVAGGYLFQHFNLIARESGSEEIASSEELSQLASSQDDGSTIAQALLRRSASLVAAQISGILRYKGQTPLQFVMEGSLFWKGYRYRETVEEYLAKLGVQPGEIRFHHIENSAIVGAGYLLGV